MPRERAGTGLAYSDVLLEYFPSFQRFLPLGFHEKQKVCFYLTILSGKSMEEKSLLKPTFPYSRYAINQRVGRELL